MHVFQSKLEGPWRFLQQPCLRLPVRSSRCFWTLMARYRSQITGPLTGLRSRINVIFERCTMHQLKTCFREIVTPTGICLFSLRTPLPETCHCICQLVHVLVLYKSLLDAQVWLDSLSYIASTFRLRSVFMSRIEKESFTENRYHRKDSKKLETEHFA